MGVRADVRRHRFRIDQEGLIKLLTGGLSSSSLHSCTTMAVIKRGIGRSPTEEKLAALADKTFLNLWTYPNLFKSDGKELCDLLAVCGDGVAEGR